MIPIRTEITEQYKHLFQNSEPVPIYRVDRSGLAWGNRILSWYREKTVGIDWAAQYQDDVLGLEPEIRIIDGVPDPVEEEILKHEVNHHEDDQEDGVAGEWLMIFGGISLTSATVGLAPMDFYVPGLLLAFGGFVLSFYQKRRGSEARANEGVELSSAIEEVGASWPKSGFRYAGLRAGEIAVGLLGSLLDGLHSRVKQTKQVTVSRNKATDAGENQD